MPKDFVDCLQTNPTPISLEQKAAQKAIAGVPKVLKEIFVDEDTGKEQTFVELIQDFRELKSPWAKEETELDQKSHPPRSPSQKIKGENQ